jgi:hypothetical protein
MIHRPLTLLMRRLTIIQQIISRACLYPTTATSHFADESMLTVNDAIMEEEEFSFAAEAINEYEHKH